MGRDNGFGHSWGEILPGWGHGVLCPSCCWGGVATAWPEVGNGLCCCQERELWAPAVLGDGCGRAVSATPRAGLLGLLQEERGTTKSRGEGAQVLVCSWQLCFILSRALLPLGREDGVIWQQCGRGGEWLRSAKTGGRELKRLFCIRGEVCCHGEGTGRYFQVGSLWLHSSWPHIIVDFPC